MLNILNKEITPSPMQDKFNARFYDILKSKKIPYEELSQQNKHNLVLKYAQVSKPDVVKRGFIKPLYINSPDIVVILRTNSIKESGYRIINEIKSPIMQVTNKLIHELGFCNPYITNLSFHITDSFNDWTLEKLQKEFLIKDLEFSTIELPQVFLLLGNDALNVFFNTGCTVQNILGDIYLAPYKGITRMFIPVPHPAYLVRDKNSYKEIVQYCKAIRSILQEIK